MFEEEEGGKKHKDKLDEIQKTEGKETEDLTWEENKQKHLTDPRRSSEKESEVFR